MAIHSKFSKNLITLVTVAAVLLWVFPVFYIFITSFKTEASVVPPSLFIRQFTLQNYAKVLTPEIIMFFKNSLIITGLSVLCSLVLGVPAAYRLVFTRMKKPESLYFWFLSTFILPPVAVLIPALVILRFLGLLDTHLGLILVYTGTHIPIIVWLVTSFFKEVPRELLEAARIDGASRLRVFFSIILPISKIGLISAGLLTFIFIWNEFFFAVNLTGSRANTLPVYMSTFLTQQGFFWARLSAISVLVLIPTLVFGMLSQKALVKGLTMGAVKG